MDINEVKTFSFTGDIQTFTIPHNGVYKLECYGAGNTNNVYDGAGTAYGGYASGYKVLKKGTVLYICVGGSSGYNGGGSGTGYHNPEWAYVSANNGSGATHIALVTGSLASIGETEFCTNEKGFLIAGGAGGCATYAIANGTTAARRGGNGGTGGNNNRFGYGNNASTAEHHHGGGGGAGYRGGYASDSSGSQVPSGGGSGGTNWVGNVPSFTYKGNTYSPTSTAGGGSGGNGQAKITLVYKGSNVKYGEQDVSVYYGSEELFGIYIGDTEI